MTEIERALLETEPFRWSHDNSALMVDTDGDEPSTISIYAGVPEGDWEYLLERWLTAALFAIPSAEIEDADIVEADMGDDAPHMAARIKLSLADDPTSAF